MTVRPRLRSAAAVLLAASVLTACGGPQKVRTTPAEPSALIGQWSATGDDVEPGTVLNVYAHELDIFTSCGILHTDWVARPGGVFLAEITTWVGNCFHRSQRVREASADWLPSGEYRGSDGCNGMGGRWRVEHGHLLWTRGVVTDAGCDNLDPIGAVALAGIDGRELVLLDAKGRETLRMIRAPHP